MEIKTMGLTLSLSLQIPLPFSVAQEAGRYRLDQPGPPALSL